MRPNFGRFFYGRAMADQDEYGLNIRERKFVELYIASGKAGKSWIDAGYSPNGADQCASRAISKAKVRKAIDSLRPDHSAKHQRVTPEMVIAGLHAEASGGETSSARTAAWTQLGRALGMFVDRVESKNTSLASELDALEARLDDEAPKMKIVVNQ
ncbi:MAG: terminase small subunit [Acidobacteria bacterium]|nr:terminase small subunit [Acidobacteriota bacterium]